VHGPASINTTTHQISLNEGMKFFALSAATGMRYFVEGDLTMLTGPGQFVTRNDADGWHLYYWPISTPIASQTIVIPNAKRVISCVGADANTNRVSHVSFFGLGAESTDFDTWSRYGTDGSGVEYDYFFTLTRFQQGNFYLENCDDITIDSVHSKNSGFEGLFLQGYVQNCTFQNSWFEHCGTGGISANGPYPGTGNTLKNNNYLNFKVSNYGEMDGSANGIRLSQSSGNVVQHFDISEGPNRGVWIHGDFAQPAGNNYCFGNAISLGKITHAVQDSSDRGALTFSFLSATSVPAPNPNNSADQIIINNINAHASVLQTTLVNAVFGANESFDQLASNINCTNIQGNQFRYNGSGSWTLTNTSFKQDGTPDPSFNPALMSPSIGLTAAFPY